MSIDLDAVPMPPTSLTLQNAHNILVGFNDMQPKHIHSDLEAQQVRAAVLCLAKASDYQILGVLADSFAQGWQALSSYTKALGVGIPPQMQPVPGPVYFKFNFQSGRCYVEPYTGQDRGVLVSYHSDYDGDPNDMYGHLPWDLFMDMT